MPEPKMWFDDEDEMLQVMNEWQKLLCLNDWYIAARICPLEDMELKDCAGESEVQWLHRTGLISLVRKEDMPIDSLLKQPYEESLIHELLHFKFIGMEEETREEAVFELIQHQLLQDMARALYMAKYNLTPDWFIADCHKQSKKGD